jgi:subtilisin family serine protease
MLRRITACLALVSVVCLSFALPSTAALPARAQNQTERSEADGENTAVRFVPGELLIQFKADATQADLASAKKMVGAALKERLKKRALGHDGVERGELELAQITAASVSLPQALAALREHPAVAFAEPNYIYTLDATSDDPSYNDGSLWGMYGDASTPANEWGSQAGEAWAAGHTGSPDVYVGVIDSGIDYNHPDLAANIWTNPFDPVDGIDNDGNGYKDDTHGWDIANNNNSVYDGTPTDSTIDAHGTHVAGTIGAVGGNGIGVAGVNWNVKIISLKFLNGNSGTSANTIKAFNYLVDLKNRHGLNIVATNNSYGGGGYSQAVHDAILRAAKADILLIAAAGNDGKSNDETARHPGSYDTREGTSTETAASYDAVVSVASINGTGPSIGLKSSYSNYGVSSVDLAAPGNQINSTRPNNTYGLMNGTSMATPHVVGAVALYKSVHPEASAAEIKYAILDTTTLTASLAGLTQTGGRLAIDRLLDYTPTAPLPPQPGAPFALGITSITASRVDIAWADGAEGEAGFKVERCTGAGCVNFVTVGEAGPDATSFSDAPPLFTNVLRYRVRAYNRGGLSAPTAPADAVPPPPAAPTNLITTVYSMLGNLLEWTDNSANEYGFRIERCAGAGCTNFTELPTPVMVAGANYLDDQIDFSTTYRYRIIAVNAGGGSTPSNVADAVRAAAPPSAPTSLTATAVSRSQVNLRWTDNALTEGGYKVERCSGSSKCTNFTQIAQLPADATAYSDTSCAARTAYRYRVRAFNAGANSAYSNIASVTTPR